MVQGKAQLHQGASKLQAGSWQMLSDASSAVQTAAQSAAQSAGRRAQQGAQQASGCLGSQLRDGAFGVRRWAASQLEGAADYTTSTMTPAVSKTLVKTVGPAVSDTLRSTARQVSPPGRRRSSLRSVLGWTALAAAIAAAAGAAGTVVWRRYRTAMAADTEADVIVYAAEDPRDITLGTAAEPDDAGTGTRPSGTSSSEDTAEPRSSSAW